MKRKRPTKAAKVSGKGKAAPAKVQPRGGASAGNRPSWDDKDWGSKTDKFLWGEFEKRLAAEKNTPKQDEMLRKRYRVKLSEWIKRMVAIRDENSKKQEAMPPLSQAQLKKAYRVGFIDGIAFPKARRALKQFKATRKGLGAARLELMEEEAGVDIAAMVAAKHIPPPADKEKDADNARSEAGEEINGELTRPVPSVESHGELAITLEALGEWLVEAIPSKGGKKARWKKILLPSRQGKPGFFTAQHRYALSPDGKRQREKSPVRQTISKTASEKLLRRLRLELAKAQASGEDQISPVVRLMEGEIGQAAVVHFLTLFHQRCTGTRREVLERRQRLAEAVAHGIERPRKIGDTKEKASKTRENDFAWIRSRRRTP